MCFRSTPEQTKCSEKKVTPLEHRLFKVKFFEIPCFIDKL